MLGGFGGWAIGGLILVLLPTLLRPITGSLFGVVGGAALFGFMLAGAAGQVVAYRSAPHVALASSCLAVAIGFALVLYGLAIGHGPLILVADLLTGLGLAGVQRGGLGTVIRSTPTAQKGWAMSLFLASGYFGGNFLVLAFGVMADAIGLQPALTVYGVIFGSLLAIAALFVLRRRR